MRDHFSDAQSTAEHMAEISAALAEEARDACVRARATCERAAQVVAASRQSRANRDQGDPARHR